MTGHVFVTRGDVTRLNVNAWLLPTDREVRIEIKWVSDVFDPAGIDTADPRFNALRSEEAFAAAADGAAGPVPVLTAVPFEGASTFRELRPRLLAGLRLAASIAKAEGRGRRPIIPLRRSAWAAVAPTPTEARSSPASSNAPAKWQRTPRRTSSCACIAPSTPPWLSRSG